MEESKDLPEMDLSETEFSIVNSQMVFTSIPMYKHLSSMRLVPQSVGTPCSSKSQSYQLGPPFVLDSFSLRLIVEHSLLDNPLCDKISLKLAQEKNPSEEGPVGYTEEPEYAEDPTCILKKGTPQDNRCNPWADSYCLKYEIFKDLYNRGLYCTNGLKYGADFLVYKGDPNLFHSEYMVKVVYLNQSLGIRELVALERVAKLTIKIARLGYVDSDRTVKYIQVEHYLLKES
ncbi:unnamed protein product [Moneuplotes crassus]|uniref:tRNA-intron lyase n=1 Tax=Euplotes crassus TaxID=5936 RepID=A0AAD1XM81_EUPCR|nr:unnamed protein product [Moneuplotes crassus]